MTDFVLIGGFWIGAWAWREVRDRLTTAGHRAVTVDLTGLGDRRGAAGPATGLETHIADVVDVLQGQDLRQAVLVGHSGAGAIVNCVAERAPDRVEGLVFVDSGPVPDGACIADFSGSSGRADTERQAIDGWRLPLPPFDVLGEAMLAGLDKEKRDLLRASAADQPLRVATDKVRLSGNARAGIRKWAILCTMPLEMVGDLIASGNPWFAGMDGPDWTLMSLPTGHWPMLSEPDRLAAMLEGW